MRKTIFLISLLILATSVSAVGPADYEGNLQVNINEDSYESGEQINTDISVSNTGNEAIVDGYLIVNLVQGNQPYYPSQKSNNDSVFHQEKIKDIYLKAGQSQELDYTYSLPEGLESGNYRVEAYFKTNRTPVSGIPFIYSAPTSDTFSVTGTGSFPELSISRTETVFTGVNERKGDWIPNSTNFKDTKWPSLTGPVGVLSTDSMDTVSGEIVIDNEASSPRSTELEVTVCEWDDTACSNEIDTISESVQVSGTGTTVPVEVQNPEDPGAYAIKIELTSNGQTQSIYRNRIIKEGNTTRIRKLSVNQPYVSEGDSLSVGLVASASADHYTDPAAEGVDATVSVETLDGDTVFEDTQEINRLSNTQVFKQLYFNETLGEALSEYRVSAELSKEDKVFDSYSYVIDYSKFSSEIEELKLNEYSFDNGTLNTELCAKTDDNAPSTGEVQTLLMKNYSVESQQSKVIEDCSSVEFEGVGTGEYELVANYGSQQKFNISAQANNQTDGSETAGEGLPLVPIAGAIIVLLMIVTVVYIRGGSE